MKITADSVKAAEKVLADNGIEEDEIQSVLQAVGYALADVELYPAPEYGPLDWRMDVAKARAALSDPARNCDLYETESERRAAFIDWYNEAFDLKGTKYEIETCDLKHNVDGILHEYIDWLFAKAKGEADEGK